jgi:hypothetical protein
MLQYLLHMYSSIIQSQLTPAVQHVLSTPYNTLCIVVTNITDKYVTTSHSHVYLENEASQDITFPTCSLTKDHTMECLCMNFASVCTFILNTTNIVTWRLKTRIVEQEERATTRQWRSKCVSAEMNQHTIIDELLEVVPSVWSVPRL